MRIIFCVSIFFLGFLSNLVSQCEEGRKKMEIFDKNKEEITKAKRLILLYKIKEELKNCKDKSLKEKMLRYILYEELLSLNYLQAEKLLKEYEVYLSDDLQHYFLCKGRLTGIYRKDFKKAIVILDSIKLMPQVDEKVWFGYYSSKSQFLNSLRDANLFSFLEEWKYRINNSDVSLGEKLEFLSRDIGMNMEKGNFDYAENQIKIGILEVSKVSGYKSPQKAIFENMLGQVYDKKGKYDLAIKHIENAGKIMREIYPDSRISDKTVAFNIYTAAISGYFTTKKEYYLNVAVKNIKQAIEIEESLKIDSSHLAMFYYDLTQVSYLNNDKNYLKYLDKAESIIEKNKAHRSAANLLAKFGLYEILSLKSDTLDGGSIKKGIETINESLCFLDSSFCGAIPEKIEYTINFSNQFLVLKRFLKFLFKVKSKFNVKTYDNLITQNLTLLNKMIETKMVKSTDGKTSEFFINYLWIKDSLIADLYRSKQYVEMFKNMDQKQEDVLEAQIKDRVIQNLQTEDLAILEQYLEDKQEINDSLVGVLKQKIPEYFNQFKFDSKEDIESIFKKIKANESLLEYAIVGNNIYILVLFEGKIEVQSVSLDSTFNSHLATFRKITSNYQYTINNPQKSWDEYIASATYLYQKLFPEEVQKMLKGKSHLYIIPDGELNYISFEALLKQKPTEKTRNYKNLAYLVKDFDISYAYSATLLFKTKNFRTPSKQKLISYGGFAPEYNKQLLAEAEELENFKNFRSNPTALLNNKKEVASIAKLYKGDEYFDLQANEYNFKKNAGKYKILHLAMHALTDDKDPLYSKFLFTNTKSDTSEDNYLNAYELYNMELNADLAVLSACNTGYGKLERGEGAMSLARAFKYAGCPSIVMSLWQADDKATSELMIDFFKNLKTNTTKSVSLRNAKLAYLNNADNITAHPYFWSNFVVLGDNSSIETPKNYWWIYVLGGAVLFGGIIMGVKVYRNKKAA